MPDSRLGAHSHKSHRRQCSRAQAQVKFLDGIAGSDTTAHTQHLKEVELFVRSDIAAFADLQHIDDDRQ